MNSKVYPRGRSAFHSAGAPYRVWSTAAKNKVNRSDHSQRGPQIVKLERFVQKKNIKRHEHAQRDDLLHDLELANAELRKTNSVSGHLKQIFEQRNAPLMSAATYHGESPDSSSARTRQRS